MTLSTGMLCVCQCVSVSVCAHARIQVGMLEVFTIEPGELLPKATGVRLVELGLSYVLLTRQCHHATGRRGCRAATVCTPPTCTALPNATPWPRGKSRMSSCSRTMRRQSNGHTALYKSVVVCGIRSITLTRLTC